jgi:hypothetical protein
VRPHETRHWENYGDSSLGLSHVSERLIVRGFAGCHHMGSEKRSGMLVLYQPAYLYVVMHYVAVLVK